VYHPQAQILSTRKDRGPYRGLAPFWGARLYLQGVYAAKAPWPLSRVSPPEGKDVRQVCGQGEDQTNQVQAEV